MTATKETILATSFVVILTMITTMTRKDDVVQGRSVITESSLNHPYCLGLLMEFVRRASRLALPHRRRIRAALFDLRERDD